MLPLSDHLTRQGQTITTCTQIRLFKGNLHSENESVAQFHSVASGKKEKIMLPLSDNLTCQRQTIATCTQIRLFKGNLLPENESVAQFHSVASGEKEKIMLPLSDPFTCQGWTNTTCTQIRLFKCNLPPQYESQHFRMQQVGKMSKSCYHHPFEFITITTPIINQTL